MVALPVAAVALGGLPTSAAETSARADGYRILFESSCGNTGGADLGVYSMRPDGSRLTPLFRRGRALEPLAVSQDGGTIAYGRVPWIYVSRADGTDLGRVVRGFAGRDYPFAISRDGRLLASAKGTGSGSSVRTGTA
jgi:hypothetical protein